VESLLQLIRKVPPALCLEVGVLTQKKTRIKQLPIIIRKTHEYKSVNEMAATEDAIKYKAIKLAIYNLRYYLRS